MAEIITDDEAREAVLNGRYAYPWGTWFNGQWWRLRYRVDFDTEPHVFRTTAANAARRLGGRIKSSIDPDTETVVLRFVTRGND